MKVGGFQRLLKREREWDANTRRAVGRIHRALIGLCQDDIEVCLKLYSAWSQAQEDANLQNSWAFRQVWSNYMPGPGQALRQQLGETSTQKLMDQLKKVVQPEEIWEIIDNLQVPNGALDSWLAQVSTAIAHASPAAWAKLFFCNHNVFKSKIEAEREDLIEALSAHKKEEERRPIDFDLLTRLRIIFAYSLPKRIYTLGEGLTDENDHIYQPLAYVENQPTIPALIGRYSVCYQRDIRAFVCSKQQTITRRLTGETDPMQVMMVSFLAKVNPEWVPEILGYSQLELGYFIASQSRVDTSSEISPVLARLMIDQWFPLDSRHVCRVLDQKLNNDIVVDIRQTIALPPPIPEVYRSGEAALPDDTAADEELGGELMVNTALDDNDEIVLDPEEDLEPAWVDLAQEGRDFFEDEMACPSCGKANELGVYYCVECGALLENQPLDVESSNGAIRGCLRVDNALFSPGDELRADVIGYEFDEDDNLLVILHPTPDPEPFLAFTQHYREGDAIEVVVKEYDVYPGDYLIALVVQEPQSRLEIVLEPGDLTFSTRGYVIQAFPLGVTIDAIIETINYEYRRVRLSRHKFLDPFQTQLFSKSHEAVVKAVVGEVTDRGVYFGFTWDKLPSGVILTAFANQSNLIKPIQEYVVGDQHIIQVSPSSRPRFVSLKELPLGFENHLAKRKWHNRLEWDEYQRKLQFTGLMTYDEQAELLSSSEDPSYRNAVTKLYFLSNQLEAVVTRQFSARAIIPQKKIGKLIGPGGETINRIREETGSSVHIDNERSLVIVGADSREQLDTAIKHIQGSVDTRLVFQYAKPAQPNEVGTLPVVPDAPSIFTAQLDVAHSKIGLVIGKGGQMIENLETRTGAQITVDGETAQVTITALTQEQIDETVYLITQLTTIYQVELRITSNKVGHVIGKGGETLKRLQSETGAEIRVNGDNATVVIQGKSAEQVELAIKKIAEIVTTFQARFSIPVSVRGRLIGRGGETIKSINKATNANIHLDSDTGIVTITSKETTNISSALVFVSQVTGILTTDIKIELVDQPVVINRSY